MIDKTCVYCGSTASVKNNLFVCENCKSVCLTKGYDTSNIYKQIKKYIDELQDIILKEIDIHKLEQLHIHGTLNKEQTLLFDMLTQFKELRIELLFFYKNKTSLGNQDVRKLIYKIIEFDKPKLLLCIKETNLKGDLK